MEFDIVIPARYESSRFPGKLLADICGKSMIQRVVERSFESSAKSVVVALDDERIACEVKKNTDATVCYTQPAHSCGTDRVAEAVKTLGLPTDRIVVNVQGDEPLICAKLIDTVARKLTEQSTASVATAATPIRSQQDWEDPNVVKCVVNRKGQALYFSRCSIPNGASLSGASLTGLAHIGIYAYRVGYLCEHASRPASQLESAERLEQLRVLFNGDQIAVHIDNSYNAIGVDVAEDIQRVEQLIRAAKA